jgi:hypothetical protein
VVLAAVVGIAGLIGIVGLLAIRSSGVSAWQQSLVAFRLTLPVGLDTEQVADWLTGIAASTHPSDRSLSPLPPVAIEIVASAHGVTHHVLVARQAAGTLLSGLRASLPGARIEAAPGHLQATVRPRLAAEAIMTSYTRPLATERAEAACRTLLASLQPVDGGSEIRYQLIMTSAGTPPRVTSPKNRRSNRMGWWEGTLPDDAEAVQAARLKQKELLLNAVLRVGVAAPTKAQARALFGRVWPVLHTSNAPSVRIRRRSLRSSVVADRMMRRDYPVTWWPLLINTAEAVALAGLPVGSASLPGLVRGTARQLPPPQTMPVRGLVVGASNYPGLAGRPLALSTNDRLRHAFVLGPTGSGKSWLLARMILQDIAAGRGVFAIDPKGDLITDVLARVDDRDAERIVVLDASRRDQPVGFNVLAGTRSEEERELTVDGVLQAFKEIWAAFWGPRSDQIMRAALSTLVHTRAAGGSAMTLCELLPLLTQPAFRRYVVGQPTLPVTLRPFWQWFDQISDGERLQAIGPVSNKVEAFTGRTPIRLMLGQSSSLDLSSIFRERRVVLVSLAKGTLGSETANLLGALLVSSLWQATMARVRIPAERRRPVFAYIDEAADIMRLPIPLSDMLAQARGLGLGIIAATQIIDQVPNSVKAAMLGTVRTQLTFAVEYDDATMLARRFAPLSVDDLTNLGPHEVAIRPCLNGVTVAPVTGVTLPLEEPVRDADVLAATSRHLYGRPRNEVEAAIRNRVNVHPARGTGRFGREAEDGRS